MSRRTLAFALAGALLLVAARPEYVSIKRKFDQIENKQANSGSRIALTTAELNAYVQTELPLIAAKGIRQPRVDLHGNNIATGHAKIDFLQVRRSQGKEPNWLLRKLLAGERDVSVTARVQSSGGNATVFLQRVEIAGVPIDGSALDFLITYYLRPNYPDAKIGQPFALKHNIERLEVSPGVAYVVMKK